MKRLILLLASVAIATPALASPDPVADTRQILAGTVTTTKAKNGYLSGANDRTTSFQGALGAYKAVRAAEPALSVKCADGTMVTAPGACPVPQPMPMPAPTPTPAPPVVVTEAAAVADPGAVGSNADEDVPQRPEDLRSCPVSSATRGRRCRRSPCTA
jgi:hypothetical protein